MKHLLVTETNRVSVVDVDQLDLDTLQAAVGAWLGFAEHSIAGVAIAHDEHARQKGRPYNTVANRLIGGVLLSEDQGVHGDIIIVGLADGATVDSLEFVDLTDEQVARLTTMLLERGAGIEP